MIRATSRSPDGGHAPTARRGMGLRGTRVGGADPRAGLMNLRRFFQDLALPHLAALPSLELPHKVRKQTHGNVGIHERDPELLREHEQVDGVVVPDAHLHVLRVEVEEEQAPKGLLDDLQGAPPSAHAVPDPSGWSARAKRFPARPEAFSGVSRFGPSWLISTLCSSRWFSSSPASFRSGTTLRSCIPGDSPAGSGRNSSAPSWASVGPRKSSGSGRPPFG